MSPNRPRIFSRRVRVSVDGLAVASTPEENEAQPEGLSREGLRVGFTVQKDLTKAPNTAEIVIYNLARATRQRLHRERSVPVVLEAGYRDTGLILLFAGEMREAFSRPEPDGTWATVLRAGDGDGPLRSARNKTGLRPGVSVERVFSDQFDALKVGLGNAFSELKRQLAGSDASVTKLADALGSGFTGSGSVAQQLDKLSKSAGLEFSVQDGELQVLKAGKVLSTTATVLSPETGLEGSPEVDAKGTMHCRVRIIPGLSPGYPVQVTRLSAVDQRGYEDIGVEIDQTVYRVERTRYVGDLWGQDFNAEIDCRDVLAGPEKKAKS
jgi:hypothetical protein